MHRSTAVLGAALAVSLLLNVVMFSRARPVATSSVRAEARAGAVERKPDAPDPLAAELEREKAVTRELRESIKRLEADREVLALSATSSAPAAPKSPTEGLREKLRRMKKLMKGAQEGVQPDQEEMLQMSGEIMEILKLGLTRSKDPKTYAEFLRACVEVSLEDEAALTPDQAGAYARVADELADALSRITASTSGERMIRELEIEADAVGRLQTILSSEQKDVLRKGGMEGLTSMSTAMGMTYLQKGTATDMIVKAWTQSYQLQDAQLPAARAAAQTYLRSLEGIKGETMSYENRIASLRAQMAALKTFEGALTSTQFERLGTQAPREFQLFDAGVVEIPEKK